MRDMDDEELAERAVRLLIMRALLEGDVIDYPVAADHPRSAVFQALETEGLIARWDRTWPLHDRYRLTERGTALIQKLQDPEAEALFADLRARKLGPAATRRHFRSRDLDPYDYSIVNDPYSSWETWDDDPGSYFGYVSAVDPDDEDEAPVSPPDREAVSGGVIDLDKDAVVLSPVQDVPVTDIS